MRTARKSAGVIPRLPTRQDAGRKLAQIDYQSHITVDRQGQQTAIDIIHRQHGKPDGELQQFHTEMTSGTSRTQTNGRVADGQLKMETITQGKTTDESFAWPAGTLGFSATEQSLAKAPLLPGTAPQLAGLDAGDQRSRQHRTCGRQIRADSAR